MDYDEGAANSEKNRQFTKQPETSSSPAVRVSSPVPDKADKTVPTTTVFCTDAGGDQSEKLIRRSSSLRVQKECASTPAQKKIVRFADVLGLDLASVRTFLDELPAVPKSAYAYHDLEDEVDAAEKSAWPTLRKGDSESSLPLPLPLPVPLESYTRETASQLRTVAKSLLPMFKSPVESSNFADRIRDNCVCLESVSVHEAPVCHIKGRIKVKNLDYCKHVYVRYTLDAWKTYDEVQASYLPNSYDSHDNDADQLLDEFTFVIYVYNVVAVGQQIEFAIRYLCRGSVYWDNNDGNNYAFRCCLDAPSLPSYFHCNANISPACTENFHSLY